jgi:hypothetical protein
LVEWRAPDVAQARHSGDASSTRAELSLRRSAGLTGLRSVSQRTTEWQTGFGRQVSTAIAALLAAPCDHAQLAATDRVIRPAREIFDEIVVAAAEPARDHGAASCHHGLDPD